MKKKKSEHIFVICLNNFDCMTCHLSSNSFDVASIVVCGSISYKGVSMWFLC